MLCRKGGFGCGLVVLILIGLVDGELGLLILGFWMGFVMVDVVIGGLVLDIFVMGVIYWEILLSVIEVNFC